ncbi:MAG: hypothetical protein AB1793_09485 [Candidatus Thermoplasmatota archaeon]
MVKVIEKTRVRRTPEQIVADLEEEIRRVKARAAAKQAKAAPEGRPFLAAVKALDRALEAAQQAKNEPMIAALEAARAPLSTLTIEMGLRLPAGPRRIVRRARAAQGA